MIQVKINNVDASGNGDVVVEGILVASGNYVSGGDTVDFTGAVKGPQFSGLSKEIPASGAPKQLWVASQAGNINFQYAPNLGSAQNNCKLVVSASNTFGTELSAGAYPAGVTGDTIGFRATFSKLQ